MTKDSTGTVSGGTRLLVLGVDTCGLSGSVALARLGTRDMEMLGQIELAGKTYSATLVAAVAELLKRIEVKIAQVGAIAVTRGPGSFTGVRVGLSAVKGLTEPGGIPVVAVSRLAVLAQKAGVAAAALDAHRNEVFVRMGAGDDAKVREVLAGRPELEAQGAVPERIGICEDAAEELIRTVWPQIERVRVEAPTAADVIELAAAKIRAQVFDDVALLDGHYLRRSDAEIFGAPAQAPRPSC